MAVAPEKGAHEGHEPSQPRIILYVLCRGYGGHSLSVFLLPKDRCLSVGCGSKGKQHVTLRGQEGVV